jgi:hypothetical protein
MLCFVWLQVLVAEGKDLIEHESVLLDDSFPVSGQYNNNNMHDDV